MWHGHIPRGHRRSEGPPLALMSRLPQASNREVIERRDRIRLRPQPDATGPEPRVVVVEVERAIQPRLHVIAEGHDPNRVPLSERRRLHARTRELPSSAIVGVQPEVRSEEHTSELQSRENLVCRLLLEK